MKDIRRDFKEWLIKQGYSEKTKSGRPSTVYEYISQINKVCDIVYLDHNIPHWELLAEDIYPILGFYNLCKKEDAQITADNFSQTKDFLINFLSSMRAYKDNIDNYFRIESYFNGLFIEKYSLIEMLMNYLDDNSYILCKFLGTPNERKKHRIALTKFFEFLQASKYTNSNSYFYNKFKEPTDIENLYIRLYEKLQNIETLIKNDDLLYELCIKGGNNIEPPMLEVEKVSEITIDQVCLILRIERHTLRRISELKPRKTSRPKYLVSDVNNFIKKNFVPSISSANTTIQMPETKKWWLVKEVIENTGLTTNQIKYLRQQNLVSYIKVTRNIYIFYPYDFKEYTKRNLIVIDKF